MDGLFVAGAVVSLVQFWRLRDRRLVPLALMLAFLAGADSREEWDAWRGRYQAGALVCALALLALLSIEDEALARRLRGTRRP